MIIYIYTPGRNDKTEIDTNVGYLANALPNQRKSEFKDAGNLAQDDRDIVIYIVAHGSPSQVGKLTPKVLSEILVEYIHAKQPNVKEIYLYACNTGQAMGNGYSYAQLFSRELSKRLTTENTIEISAPNGIIVFYPNGELDIVKDTSPLESNDALMREIKEIDTSNVAQAKEKIKPYLDPSPFNSFNAIPAKRIIEQSKMVRIDYDAALDAAKYPYVYFSKIYFFQAAESNMANVEKVSANVSNATYNYITELYAEVDTESIAIDSQQDDPKNLETHYYKK